MTATETPVQLDELHRDETLIRRLLRNLDKGGRSKVMTACQWTDSSSISKVVSGEVGIKLDQLDALLAALGLSIQQEDYMDYLRKGNTIGANCCRASASLGYCKAR